MDIMAFSQAECTSCAENLANNASFKVSCCGKEYCLACIEELKRKHVSCFGCKKTNYTISLEKISADLGEEEWKKVLQEQRDKEKAWLQCENEFSKSQEKFYATKEQWHIKQEEREKIQADWVEVVQTKRFRVNVMTLGFSYLLGFTSDILKEYKYNIDKAEAEKEGAALQANFIKKVSEQAERLRQREEELRIFHGQVKSRKGALENFTRKLNEVLDYSGEVGSELEKAKKDIISADEEAKACNQKIEDIKKKKEEFVKEAHSVLSELYECERKLSAMTDHLGACQTKIQECIQELKSKSDSLKIADIAVIPAALGAQGVGLLFGIAANVLTLGIADVNIVECGKTAKGFIDGGLPEKQQQLLEAEERLNESDNTLDRLKQILSDCKEELSVMQKIKDMLPLSTEPNTFLKILADLYHRLF